MKVIQKVVVKHVLTEESRQTLKERFVKKREEANKEYQQLLFEKKRLEKREKGDFGKSSLLKEMNLRKERMEQATFQLEQLDLLPVGYEINEGEVHAVVNIAIGDSWDQLKEKTIVVKDGKVVEIRE